MTRRRIEAKANRRIGAPRRLAALLGGALGPAARRRGFAEASLLAEWPSIVGPELAARCRPVKLSFARGHAHGGVLHLHLSSAAALELQHQEPQMLERINGFFGHLAVARLRLVHAPLPLPAAAPAAAPPLPENGPAQDAMLEAITDPRLREALAGLGRVLRRAARGDGAGSA